MKNRTSIETFSLPMRWLSLAAAIEIGLVMLAATPVQSETVATQVSATSSSIVDYARAVAQAIRRTETGVLPGQF